MDKATSISEMHKFRFGSKVFCSDGEDGVLTHVCFDSATSRLTHVGVKQGRIFGKTVYLAVEQIVDASSEAVRLGITLDELAKASASEPTGALFDGRSAVRQDNGSARGTLLLVGVHPDNDELAYIVARGLHAGQDTLLLGAHITRLERGQIAFSLPDAALQTLPPYRSDAELQREVEEILFDLTPLHVDFKGMRVRVLDSVLYLDGNISSSLRGDMVQDQAMGVQGLLEIKNRLVGDDKLAGDLAMALSRDPRTRELPIGVYPRLGVVRLSGAVHNGQQKEAAGEIASKFAGVQAVTNDLVVDPKADMLRVMSSAAGGEADDIVPGKYIRHTK
ncbi:BON domain-containing protein [Ktedonosporobacter rubrisoli]|uniref:BON domain-containing protein n=1 Tax=Ktedonosporobacter rubrisoli TaxID=2509675 RepID=A0A4P6K2M6_KTERU|nr:BON domain-containing protein [Ktedonosporobacter rubrisoli]QBD82399.1 BON domain-containing protein [Ktedonosporobacter rubrisoli]